MPSVSVRPTTSSRHHVLQQDYERPEPPGQRPAVLSGEARWGQFRLLPQALEVP